MIFWENPQSTQGYFVGDGVGGWFFAQNSQSTHRVKNFNFAPPPDMSE